jgi:hypothetical protein
MDSTVVLRVGIKMLEATLHRRLMQVLVLDSSKLNLHLGLGQ